MANVANSKAVKTVAVPAGGDGPPIDKGGAVAVSPGNAAATNDAVGTAANTAANAAAVNAALAVILKGISAAPTQQQEEVAAALKGITTAAVAPPQEEEAAAIAAPPPPPGGAPAFPGAKHNKKGCCLYHPRVRLCQPVYADNKGGGEKKNDPIKYKTVRKICPQCGTLKSSHNARMSRRKTHKREVMLKDAKEKEHRNKEFSDYKTQRKLSGGRKATQIGSNYDQATKTTAPAAKVAKANNESAKRGKGPGKGGLGVMKSMKVRDVKTSQVGNGEKVTKPTTKVVQANEGRKDHDGKAVGGKAGSDKHEKDKVGAKQDNEVTGTSEDSVESVTADAKLDAAAAKSKQEKDTATEKANDENAKRGKGPGKGSTAVMNSVTLTSVKASDSGKEKVGKRNAAAATRLQDTMGEDGTTTKLNAPLSDAVTKGANTKEDVEQPSEVIGGGDASLVAKVDAKIKENTKPTNRNNRKGGVANAKVVTKSYGAETDARKKRSGIDDKVKAKDTKIMNEDTVKPERSKDKERNTSSKVTGSKEDMEQAKDAHTHDVTKSATSKDKKAANAANITKKSNEDEKQARTKRTDKADRIKSLTSKDKVNGNKGIVSKVSQLNEEDKQAQTKRRDKSNRLKSVTSRNTRRTEESKPVVVKVARTNSNDRNTSSGAKGLTSRHLLTRQQHQQQQPKDHVYFAGTQEGDASIDSPVSSEDTMQLKGDEIPLTKSPNVPKYRLKVSRSPEKSTAPREMVSLPKIYATFGKLSLSKIYHPPLSEKGGGEGDGEIVGGGDSGISSCGAHSSAGRLTKGNDDGSSKEADMKGYGTDNGRNHNKDDESNDTTERATNVFMMAAGLTLTSTSDNEEESTTRTETSCDEKVGSVGNNNNTLAVAEDAAWKSEAQPEGTEENDVLNVVPQISNNSRRGPSSNEKNQSKNTARGQRRSSGRTNHAIDFPKNGVEKTKHCPTATRGRSFKQAHGGRCGRSSSKGRRLNSYYTSAVNDKSSDETGKSKRYKRSKSVPTNPTRGRSIKQAHDDRYRRSSSKGKRADSHHATAANDKSKDYTGHRGRYRRSKSVPPTPTRGRSFKQAHDDQYGRNPSKVKRTGSRHAAAATDKNRGKTSKSKSGRCERAKSVPVLRQQRKRVAQEHYIHGTPRPSTMYAYRF